MEYKNFKNVRRTLSTLVLITILLSSIAPVVAGAYENGGTYAYDSSALTPHPNVAEWIEIVASEEFTDITLQIYDGNDLLNISLGDVGAAHGPIGPCSAAAFKASQTAFLVWDGFPARGDLEIISAHPSNGHIKTFEYILNSSDDVTVKLPEGTDIINLTIENYNYRFIERLSGDMVVVSVKESLFPDGFFELRKKCKTKVATPDEMSAFKLMKGELMENILYLPAEDVFEVNYFISATDSDNDGVPDAWDEEPDTPAGHWVNQQGIGRMLGDMNGDGKLTSVDALMILQAGVGIT